MNGREAFRNLMERLSNNVTLQEWELCNEDMQTVENALDKLSQIENGDGGESSLMLEYLNKMFEVDRSYDDNAGLADAYGGKTEQMIFMENYILKSQQRERELELYKKLVVITSNGVKLNVDALLELKKLVGGKDE